MPFLLKGLKLATFIQRRVQSGKWSYTFFKAESGTRFYIYFACLLAILYILNFHFKIGHKTFGQYRLGPWGIIAGFIYYGLPYFTTHLIYSLSYKKNYLYNKGFMISGIFTILVLSFHDCFNFQAVIIRDHVPLEAQSWVKKTSGNFLSSVCYMLPIYLWWQWKDKNSFPFYGASFKWNEVKIFLIILLLFIPIVWIASGTEGFLRAYPVYKDSDINDYFHLSKLSTVSIFEIFYGLDYIAVEFFFRGFMVLGLMAWSGNASIYAMVTVYFLIHFGKPPAEAISSIAGGLLLGIVALKTRSVAGGIIIHLGIAWMMELAAFIQK